MAVTVTRETRELLSHPTTGRGGRRLMETSGSRAPGDTDSGRGGERGG